MFGLLSFRVKVLATIKKEFRYEPSLSGELYKIYKTLTKTIRNQGGNEFDASIAFMFLILDSLDENDDSSFPFRSELVNNACYLSKQASLDVTRDTAMDLFREYDSGFFDGTDI